MAPVNDYLKKLLYQYDCVVVPELGAFLTHFQSANFTEASGLYLPPRKRVAYNEALRLDDGILANYIMLHEPVTREEAQRHINLFVSELRQQVTQLGRFELDGIGTFSQNEEGRLQFDPSLRHNFFGEAYGMSALSTQLVNRQPLLQPALEAVPVTALGPVSVRDEEPQLTPYRPALAYWRVAAAVLLVGSLGAISYVSVIAPGQPLQSSLDPANLLRTSVSFVERLTSPPAEPARVAIVQKVTAQPVVEETVPIELASVEPEIAEDVVAVPAPLPAREPGAVSAKAASTPMPTPASKPVTTKEMPAPVAKPVRTEPHYTVIAGVFSYKSNALQLAGRLHKAGYDDAFVIMPERGHRGRYKVAAVGSAIREEAVEEIPAISELAGSEAWLMKN